MKTTAIHLLFLVIKIATAGAAVLYHDLKYDTDGGGFIGDDKIMIEDDEMRFKERIQDAALYHDLEFVEGGGLIVDDEMKYIERILINPQTDTVLYDVPKHAKVEHGAYLTDYQSRFTFMKLEKKKKCYAIPIEDNEPTPSEIEAGIRQFNGKFPKNKYWAKNINILPVEVIDDNSLSQTTKDFCCGYPVLKVIKTNDVTEMERTALNAIYGYLNGKTEGDMILPEYVLCKESHGTEMSKSLNICKEKYGKNILNEKIIIKCRFVNDKTCVYNFNCTYKASIKKFNCEGVHQWNTNHCCSVTCI